MLKTAVIGVGKMGISHLAILSANPKVEICGVVDKSKIVLDILERYSDFPCFTDFKKMISLAKPQAAIVSVPTKFHYELVKELLSNGIHVFSEKPFCLTPEQSGELVELANWYKCVNQVGYHNKFIGTFQETKRLVKSGVIGKICNFRGESYGPVVTNKQKDNWRSDAAQGGGCLLDYASHVIDLIIDILGPVKNTRGSIMKSIFSNQVEDAVYAILELSSKITGTLSVNWSDASYRKMSTTVTIEGTNGKIISDATELKVFLNSPVMSVGYVKGWNIKYVTDLTNPVDFYLRGEEYSAQMNYFVKACSGIVPNDINTFYTAWITDKAIDTIRNNSI